MEFAAHLWNLAAAEPSRAGLYPVEPLAAEQTFLLHEIAGLRPMGTLENCCTNWKSTAPMVHVATLGYGIDEAHSVPSFQRKVYVEVWQMPNIAWARYQKRYVAEQASADCQSCVSTVSKFGNQVSQIAEREDEISFVWSSKDLFISVTKENLVGAFSMTPAIAAAQEEVARLYLEKYPSDL